MHWAKRFGRSAPRRPEVISSMPAIAHKSNYCETCCQNQRWRSIFIKRWMGNGGDLRKGLAQCRVRAARSSPGWPHTEGAYPLLRTRWDLRADSGALSGRALDPKPPAQACDALAHRLQTEVSRKSARRIEAFTIVANLQENLTRVLLQPQLHTLSLSVLDRVVQGL